MFSVLSFSLYIFLLGISPLPALPIIILSYKFNNFFGGAFSVLLGGGLANILLFAAGRISRRSFLKFRIFKKAISLSDYLGRISTRDLFLIRLSGLLPSKITSIGCGLSGCSFYKFILSLLLSFIPFQFLYYFLATKIDPISNLLNNLGLNMKISEIISIMSICSLFIIILLVMKFIFKRKFEIQNF